MWYCKIVDGSINLFANSDKVPIGDDMVPLPEGLDPTNVQLVDGQLIKDPNSDARQLEAQWVSVRAQQSDLLYKSDWTCSVIDPPAPILAQRDQWIAYRQALRDVTKQSDPFNIEWPVPPA